MLEFFKRLFSPKFLIEQAVNSLDLLVPMLAKELEEAKEKIEKLNSHEKAQVLVDKVQSFLRKRFELGASD